MIRTGQLLRWVAHSTTVSRHDAMVVLDVEAGVMAAQGISDGLLYRTATPAGQMLDEDTIERISGDRGVDHATVQAVLDAETRFVNARWPRFGLRTRPARY